MSMTRFGPEFRLASVFRSISSAKAFAVLALTLGAGTSAAAQTVDDVVRRYLQARGGVERLRSVQSLRLTGTVEVPGLDPAPFVMELKRPAKMRTEITLGGQLSIRAYDGRRGWSQPPVPGEHPRPMDPEDAAEARAQADVDLSPLVDADAKGYTVELSGRDRLPDGETWKLVVRHAGEPTRTLHIDTRSNLVVRAEEVRAVEGRGQEFVTEIGDYRHQRGLTFPHRIEVGPRGSPERQRLLIRSVEVNPALDDARFSMPGA